MPVLMIQLSCKKQDNEARRFLKGGPEFCSSFSLPKEECLSVSARRCTLLFWIGGGCCVCLLILGEPRTIIVTVCARHSTGSDACRDQALVGRHRVRFSDGEIRDALM